MPRRRHKFIRAKKEPLVFTESPVNIVHHLPSPVLGARHPPTAQSVPVEDFLDVSWVSPQFATVPLNGHSLQRGTRRKKHAHRNDGVSMISHENSSNVNFIVGKCSKFKSLVFVGDSDQTQKECITVMGECVDIGESISHPTNRGNKKRSHQITLKQKNRNPNHKDMNGEGHKDCGANVNQNSKSTVAYGLLDEGTLENSIERYSQKSATRKCKDNFTKIKKKVSPKNKSDISTSEPEDETRNIEKIFKKFKTGRKRVQTNALMEIGAGSSFRGDDHALQFSVNGNSHQRSYDKYDSAPVKDLYPDYSARDKIENALQFVRQFEDMPSFRSTLNLKKHTCGSFSNNSNDSKGDDNIVDIDIQASPKFSGLKTLFLNHSPSEQDNTDQYKILVKDTPESEYGIPYRKRQLRKLRKLLN